jgi:hypothetical protein
MAAALAARAASHDALSTNTRTVSYRGAGDG